MKKISCLVVIAAFVAVASSIAVSSSQQGDSLPPECLLPLARGKCRALFTRYFYDAWSNECKEFNYGGCKGNENNFETKEDCELRCFPAEGQKWNVPKPRAESCSLGIGIGICMGSTSVPRYYYDPRFNECKLFEYNGCGGNANNYETQEACESDCLRN